jgi:hypothetical protein
MITLQWIQENYVNALQALTALVVAGELITRMTPTKDDDGFVSRIGDKLDWLLDFLKVPNLRKSIDKDGGPSEPNP